MKKLICLILAVILTLSLCACGADGGNTGSGNNTVDPATLQSHVDSASDYIGTVIDTSKLTYSDQTDQPNSLYRNWYSEDEEPTGNELSMDVELLDKTITVGKTTVKELKELGYNVVTDVEEVEPNTEIALSIAEYDEFCALTVSNNTDKNQNIMDLPVDSMILGGSEEYSVKYSYKGLTTGSTLEEAIKTLGEPAFGITVMADGPDTTIELNYTNSQIEGDFETSDSLDVYLTYDVEKDAATISNITLRRQIYDYSKDGIDPSNFDTEEDTDE